MSATTITVLSPPGVAAIAALSLTGPNAWSICRALFDRDLPDKPVAGHVCVGRIGEPPGDEVVLSIAEDSIEVHCHGGRRVVRWLVQQCVALGAIEADARLAAAWSHLPNALTERTAAILLDQLGGASGDASRFVDIGRHLTTPWRVVVAGPPNAGKSSLINALAGFARSVVSSMAGTTRDVASVDVAFDGWPIELIDTAGVRYTDDSLELAGVAATFSAAKSADLVLWVTAASEPPLGPPGVFGNAICIRNKCDLAAANGIAVSATEGIGLVQLTDEIVRRLVPVEPPPGAAVQLPLAIHKASTTLALHDVER